MTFASQRCASAPGAPYFIGVVGSNVVLVQSDPAAEGDATIQWEIVEFLDLRHQLSGVWLRSLANQKALCANGEENALTTEEFLPGDPRFIWLLTPLEGGRWQVTLAQLDSNGCVDLATESNCVTGAKLQQWRPQGGSGQAWNIRAVAGASSQASSAGR